MAEDGLVYSGIVANLAKCFCYPYQYFNLWLQKHKLHWSFDWTKQLQDKAHINCQYQLLGKYVEGEVCAEVLNFPGFSGCLDFKNSVKRTKRTSFSVVSCRTFVQNYENLPAVSKNGNSAGFVISFATFLSQWTEKTQNYSRSFSVQGISLHLSNLISSANRFCLLRGSVGSSSSRQWS